jgi:hypothetical protein
MKIELHIEKTPDDAELKLLLGDSIYHYYKEISSAACALLCADFEVWSNGGRRGKYHHGYRFPQKSVSLDIYLSEKQITCDFHLWKQPFSKILKRRESFSKPMQTAIDAAVNVNNKHGSGYWLNLIIPEKPIYYNGVLMVYPNFQDLMNVIVILSGNITLGKGL